MKVGIEWDWLVVHPYLSPVGPKLEVRAKLEKLKVINQVLDVLCRSLHMFLFSFLVWLPEIVI